MRHSARSLGARIAQGVDVVITGHVHEPSESVVRAGGCTGRVIVLGAWGDAPGAHAVWDNELRLIV